MENSKRFVRHLIPYLVATVAFGTVYAVGQQILRQGANDPQVALVEDVAPLLAAGVKPTDVVPHASVDIAKNLSQFMAVYDDQGTPLASSGTLNGSAPALPSGVFAYTKDHGEDRITWQPEKGVRQALVVKRFAGAQSGYIAAGRSLREVEARESNLESLVALGWLASIVLLAIKSILR